MQLLQLLGAVFWYIPEEYTYENLDTLKYFYQLAALSLVAFFVHWALKKAVSHVIA